jgi:gamma-glutamylputrescine oxidase
VLEAGAVGSGASGRNGGQAIFGYSCDQSKIARWSAWSFAADVRLVAGRLQLCTSAARASASTRNGGRARAPADQAAPGARAAGMARDLAENYGYALEWWPREQLRALLASERYLGALYDPRSGHLQPLAYVRGLARAALSLGVRIHEARRCWPAARREAGAAHRAGEVSATSSCSPATRCCTASRRNWNRG